MHLFKGNASGFCYYDNDYRYYYSLYRSSDSIIYNVGECIGWEDGTVYLLNIYYR